MATKNIPTNVIAGPISRIHRTIDHEDFAFCDYRLKMSNEYIEK